MASSIGRVFVSARIPTVAVDRIRVALPHHTIDYRDSELPLSPEEFSQHAKGCAGIFCNLSNRVDESVLNAAGESLKVVSTMSVGADHIDVKTAKARGIKIGYTPGVLSESTAELALLLMLATARRLPEAIDAVHSGEWSECWRPLWLTGKDLFGSTVGIVGLGGIGQALARRLRAFDCRILYSGPRDKPEAAEYHAVRVPFEQLLAESDFVSIHCPLTERTRHLFGAKELALMKESAILVNTSRGGTIDQDALYTALTSGQIRAAGLDVTTPEPLPVDHPLLALPNCLVLPHIGSATTRTRTRMAMIAAENLIAGVLDRPLKEQL
mmetsp:Transcript_14584/g.37143  ORF Transcript_14584/g.37143 Transcript_14584/m.37143 type:complete len:326 (-) Transcript_14584:56-1033(-)